MATLRISEYGSTPVAAGGGPIPIAQEPALAHQDVTFTTATQSAAFNAGTVLIKLNSTDACRVLFGDDPTALATSEYLAAGIDHWRGVRAGQKVSVYDGSS